ncbi:MAG: hypothetical protein KF708_13625 [Pirellulales bacterium]|nr:hypothetical protein [Pirellulales bacterium]
MSNVAHFDPNPTPPPSKNWFGRNWLWFVPVVLLSTGCFCCLGCGGLFFGVLQSLKSSEPYQMTLAHVQSDPEVIELLGEPITDDGYFVGGNISVENGDGNATLYFKVKGPNGTAGVSSNAVRETGQWRLTYVEVAPDDGSDPIVWPPEARQQIPEIDLRFDGAVMPADESPVDETADPATEEPTEDASQDSRLDSDSAENP